MVTRDVDKKYLYLIYPTEPLVQFQNKSQDVPYTALFQACTNGSALTEQREQPELLFSRSHELVLCFDWRFRHVDNGHCGRP